MNNIALIIAAITIGINNCSHRFNQLNANFRRRKSVNIGGNTTGRNSYGCGIISFCAGEVTVYITLLNINKRGS